MIRNLHSLFAHLVRGDFATGQRDLSRSMPTSIPNFAYRRDGFNQVTTR